MSKKIKVNLFNKLFDAKFMQFLAIVKMANILIELNDRVINLYLCPHFTERQWTRNISDDNVVATFLLGAAIASYCNRIRLERRGTVLIASPVHQNHYVLITCFRTS